MFGWVKVMKFRSYVRRGSEIVMAKNQANMSNESGATPKKVTKGLSPFTQKLYFRIQKYFGFGLWGY